MAGSAGRGREEERELRVELRPQADREVQLGEPWPCEGSPGKPTGPGDRGSRIRDAAASAGLEELWGSSGAGAVLVCLVPGNRAHPTVAATTKRILPLNSGALFCARAPNTSRAAVLGFLPPAGSATLDVPTRLLCAGPPRWWWWASCRGAAHGERLESAGPPGGGRCLGAPRRPRGSLP